MITKFGKRFLTNYLAGNSDFAQKELAFGIGSTAANGDGNDTRLVFEFYRVPITMGSIEIVNIGTEQSPSYTYKAVYQTVIPQDIAGVISEIALYPAFRISKNNFDSNLISQFDNNILWTDSNGGNPQLQLNTSQLVSKIGENMVYVQTPASTIKEYTTPLGNLDLSGYSVNDSIAIAYKKADNNVSKIRLKFYSSITQYCFVDFTPEAMGGTPDKIQSTTLNNLFSNTSTTPPDFKNIIKLGLEVTANSSGTTTVYFDGIRINDEDTFDANYGMISRSVLTGGNIITKTSGRQVDIEYKLQLGF